MIAIRNIHKCAYNPKTYLNEETFALKDGRTIFSSDIMKNTTTIDEGVFRKSCVVKGEENISVSRTYGAATEKSKLWNKNHTMEFGAQKNSDSPYRYDSSSDGNILEAWRRNDTYLSTSVGRSHGYRELFVVDVDDDIYERNFLAVTPKQKLKLVMDAIDEKFRQIKKMGLPLPSAVSIHMSNGHYQMHWYLNEPIRKLKFFIAKDTKLCTDMELRTLEAESYSAVTRMLNILFDGDTKFTGWRCRNIYCNHLEDYVNFSVHDGSLSPVTHDTDFVMHDASQLCRSIVVMTAKNGDKLSRIINPKFKDDFDNVSNACRNIYDTYIEPKTEAVSQKNDKPVENSEESDKKSISYGKYLAAAKYKHNKAFAEYVKAYGDNKVGTVCDAYMNETSRHHYWISSPLLLRYLEPDITKEKAHSILTKAYNMLLNTNREFGDSRKKGRYMDYERKKDFEDGWKYASGKKIRQWKGGLSGCRERSAETNMIKGKWRKLLMFNYIIYGKIDATCGLNSTLIAKIAEYLNVCTFTVRKMMKDCGLKTSKARTYVTRGTARLNKAQVKTYNMLYNEIQNYLIKSNKGKNTKRIHYSSCTLAVNDNFCAYRNHYKCSIENLVGEKGEELIPYSEYLTDMKTTIRYLCGDFKIPVEPPD